MTDLEILWAFQNAMPLIQADNVDHKDQKILMSILEKAASDLIPIAHKYVKGGRSCATCVNCKNPNANYYGGLCKLYGKHPSDVVSCYYSVERKLWQWK